MKMYYCYLCFVRPNCRKREFTCKTVLLAPTFSRAREMYIEMNAIWIEQFKNYREFYIGVSEQKDGVFTFR
mgnify:CR=1 FL=1